jgi:hypothetical protein
MERKLSDRDALVIRAVCILNHKRYGSKALAEMFCCSRTTIERIVNRETYRNLPPRTLPPLPSDYCINVPLMVGVVRDGAGVEIKGQMHYRWRDALPNETPERFVREVVEDGPDSGKPKWEHVMKAWEPVSNLTAAAYEQDARWWRRDIAGYAEKYRKRHGLEMQRKRKSRRTKRQMEWARKFAPNTV